MNTGKKTSELQENERKSCGRTAVFLTAQLYRTPDLWYDIVVGSSFLKETVPRTKSKPCFRKEAAPPLVQSVSLPTHLPILKKYKPYILNIKDFSETEFKE